MAMEDPLVLHTNTMSFNPFLRYSPHPASSSSPTTSRPPPPQPQPAQRRRRIDNGDCSNDDDDDSWHTNVSGSSGRHHGSIGNSRDVRSPNSSSSREPSSSSSSSYARLSSGWFASWTTTTTATSPTPNRTAAAASSAINIHGDHRATNRSAGMSAATASHHRHNRLPPALSQTTAPARSMTMNRGFNSPESDATGGPPTTTTTTTAHNHSHPPSVSLPAPPGEKGGPTAAAATTAGGDASAVISQNGPRAHARRPQNTTLPDNEPSVDGGEVDDDDDERGGHVLPPYPYPRSNEAPPRQRQTTTNPTRTNGELLEEFPPSETKKKPTTTTTTPTRARTRSGRLLEEFPPPEKEKIIFGQREERTFDESTFPGFALFQTAVARHRLGRHGDALAATAECLRVQMKSFDGNNDDGDGSGAAAAAVATDGSRRTDPNTFGSAVRGGFRGDANEDNANTMTALDLRGAILTGVGSSVLGVVKSLKESSESAYHARRSLRDGRPPHRPSAAVSRFPSRACVARALLLRGRLLAPLGHAENAARYAETAIAIQRKLITSSSSDEEEEEELVGPLLFLANLRTSSGRYDEADAAYEEAVAILRRTAAARTTGMRVDEEGNNDERAAARQRIRPIGGRIAGEIATALFLHGKSYHRRRMHAAAFERYNEALALLRRDDGGASSTTTARDDPRARKIARCMRSGYALEKLVSGYWDDEGAI